MLRPVSGFQLRAQSKDQGYASKPSNRTATQDSVTICDVTNRAKWATKKV